MNEVFRSLVNVHVFHFSFSFACELATSATTVQCTVESTERIPEEEFKEGPVDVEEHCADYC